MKKVEMVEGSLPKNIIFFSIPVILTGILSLLFHTCDMIVVGRFSDSKALGAVGSSGSLINFFVGTAMSLSLGVNVLAAQSLGAQNTKKVKHLIHTAIPAGFLIGLF